MIFKTLKSNQIEKKNLLKFIANAKKDIILLSILSTLSSGILVISTYLTKLIIDSATAHRFNDFIAYGILYAFLLIVILLLNSFHNYQMIKAKERSINTLQKKFMNAFFLSKWHDVSTYHTGDIITRITKDINTIVDFFIFSIPKALGLIIQLIISFIMILKLQPYIGLFGFTIIPLTTLFGIYLSQKIKPLQSTIDEHEGNYRSVLTESIQNAIIIRTFENEYSSITSIEKLQNTRLKLILNKSMVTLKAFFIINIGYTISTLVVLIWGAYLIYLGSLSFGSFVVVTQLLTKLQGPVKTLVSFIPKYINTISSIERCLPFYTDDEINKPINQLNTLSLGIQIDNLHFGYSSEREVISNFSFNISPGEKIAIIGMSGIGKTTLLRLIMDLLKPTKGSITNYSDSIQFKNSPIHYTYVPQGNTLFSGSIKSNLLLAKNTATIGDINKALMIADAFTFVNKLEHGINTSLGEKGLGLSEGQLQRICIARAILRDAPILLLDEATSSLDKQTEENVIRNIYENYPNKTVIAITHRNSILQYVDRIIELNASEVFSQDIVHSSN